MDNMNTSNGV